MLVNRQDSGQNGIKFSFRAIEALVLEIGEKTASLTFRNNSLIRLESLTV